MKSMILVLKPEECCNLMNGKLSLLVRKMFSKDYVGWVYIYCTKKANVSHSIDGKLYIDEKGAFFDTIIHRNTKTLNGKVVARFWCDKIKSIWKTTTNIWTYGSDLEPNFYKESCLNDIELDRYFKPTKVGFGKVYGYAIHITKLEIFDKPKELSEFQGTCNKSCEANRLKVCRIKPYCNRPLTKAPTNYCYVEG